MDGRDGLTGEHGLYRSAAAGRAVGRRSLVRAAGWTAPAVALASAAPAYAGSTPVSINPAHGRSVDVSAWVVEEKPGPLPGEVSVEVEFRIDLNIHATVYELPNPARLSPGTEIVVRSSTDWGMYRDHPNSFWGGSQHTMLHRMRRISREMLWDPPPAYMSNGRLQGNAWGVGAAYDDLGEFPDGAPYMENGYERDGRETTGHAQGQDWTRTFRHIYPVPPLFSLVMRVTMTRPLHWWVTRLPFVQVGVRPAASDLAAIMHGTQDYNLSCILTLGLDGSTSVVKSKL